MDMNIDYTTMPRTYEVCWHRTCPLAATCLRQLAAEHLTEEKRYVTSVNLRATHPETGRCRDYRPAQFVRHAYGHQGEVVPHHLVETGQHHVLPLLQRTEAH